MKNTHFKLFSYNILVWGEQNCAVYDLQNCEIHFIPNVLYDILKELEQVPLITCELKYSSEEYLLVMKHLLSLVDKGLGFFCEHPELYPPIDLEWHCSSVIETAVIEYGYNAYSIKSLASQLNMLLCKYLEVRISQYFEKGDLDFLAEFEHTTVRALNLVFTYREDLDLEFLKGCFVRYKKLKNIILLDSPVIGKISISKNEDILYLKDSFEDFYNGTGKGPDQHIVNKQFFMESLKYNAFYNRKIAINKKGEMKNDLSHQACFENINQRDIWSAVREGNLTDLWHASADRITDVSKSAKRYSLLITKDLIKIDKEHYKFKL